MGTDAGPADGGIAPIHGHVFLKTTPFRRARPDSGVSAGHPALEMSSVTHHP